MVMMVAREGGGGYAFSLFISFYYVYISFHSKLESSCLPGTKNFWWGCDCDCDRHSCDGEKTKSTPSLLDLARTGV